MNPTINTRVVHLVATASGWGGLERAGVEVATQQCLSGMDVVLVASKDVCSRLPEGVQGVPFDFSASRHNPLFLWRLIKVLRSISPGILHLHANKGASIGKMVRPFLPKVKTVATIHNTKKTVSAFKGHNAVVAVSKKAGESLKGIPHKVIWNAISKPGALVAPVDLPKKEMGDFTVAAYGRFVAAKGFDVLLEAIAPLEHVNLWLVGDGKLRPDIERQVAQLGLQDRVWFPGFRKDAEAIVSHSDMFALPSRYEGFPFTLVEMLHQRVPIIAAKVAGAEEILPAQCLVEIEDVEALRERIRWAMESPEEHRALMEPVFSLAERELEIGYYCEQLNAVYLSVL